MPTLLSLLIVWLAATAPGAAQARREWQDLYRDAIDHVAKGEWKQAEDKLTTAQKAGPPSGRDVIRRGVFARQDYFPEYYLGIVYLNTERAIQAETQFKVARARGLDPREKEFAQLPGLEARAASLAKAEREKAAAPDPKQVFRQQIESARAAIADGRFDDAERIARQARASNVDNAAADDMLVNVTRGRANARVQAALKGTPGLAELRRLLSEYGNAGINLDEVVRRIEGLEAAERRNVAERAAMVSFYSGNYGQSLNALTEAEKSGAGLSARGQFYRAVALASQATRGKSTNQNLLREARKAWAAANERPDDFKADLRYISPRILQLLRGS